MLACARVRRVTPPSLPGPTRRYGQTGLRRARDGAYGQQDTLGFASHGTQGEKMHSTGTERKQNPPEHNRQADVDEQQQH
jgi:hypothetical protein